MCKVNVRNELVKVCLGDMNSLDEMACYFDKIEEENCKLKKSINEALNILYSYGETLNPDFQKEMLEVLIKKDK